MDYKPKDLFLSAIDIFAVFFPGAIMLFLRLDYVSIIMNNLFQMDQNDAGSWVAFIIGSYLLGQILIALTVVFDRVENNFKNKEVLNDPIFHYVTNNIPHEENEEITRQKSYYRAYSFIRLNSASALEQIEKETTDYKLFRSLTLVAGIDFIISLALGQWQRAVAELAFFAFCFWRFMNLRNHTEKLVYEFYYLWSIQEKEKKQKSNSKTTSEHNLHPK